MAIQYNNFTRWIAKDDWQTWTARLIDSSNVTWLSTWYWLTLWQKSNKLFTTNHPMRWIYIQPQARTTDNANNFVFGDAWEVYRFDWADNTPLYTFPSWNMVWGLFEISGEYYCLVRQWPSVNNYDMAQATNEDFTIVNPSYSTNILAHAELPPVIKTAKYTYIWASQKVVRLPDQNNPTPTDYNLFPWWTIQGISKVWNQFYNYTTNQEMVIWDWNSTTVTWTNKINFPPRKTHQIADRTYVVSRDWEFRTWNGYQLPKIVNFVKSDRLEDNSQYLNKFDFSWTDEERWQYIANVWETIYVWCNDSTPWIYIYDNVLEWTAKWLHKAITTIHDWTQIDEIYAIDYDHTQDRVFYTYKAGSTYWVDYINTRSKETQKLGYWVTEVFNANTSFTKSPKVLRVTTSNTSWNNYIKVYYRVNNWNWNLIRTINEEDNSTRRTEMTKDFNKNNIDVQFKVELYNDTQWEKAPILHELYYDYDITPK